jgi:hypothetical protein
MLNLNVKRLLPWLPLAVLLATPALAAPPGPLKLPSFEALAAKASQSVTVTLDGSLLGMASGFLSSDDPEDAAAKDVIRGLKGIYVRSYTFDTDFAYPVAEVDAVRRQLQPPGWQPLVTAHDNKEHSQVDVYVSVENGVSNGLAIIASGPREFTIVNIVGSIDLAKLHHLEGKMGVPKLPDVPPKK